MYRPTMNLYKNTLLKYWEKAVQNSPIITIISLISGHPSLKI